MKTTGSVELTSFGRPVALCRRVDELTALERSRGLSRRERAELTACLGGNPCSSDPPHDFGSDPKNNGWFMSVCL